MDTQNSDPQNPQEPNQSPQGANQGTGQTVPEQYVSGGNKEHAPIGQPRETVQVSHPESTPAIADEAAEAGVEASQPAEIVKLPEEVKQVGVVPAKESVPAATEPTVQAVVQTPVPPAQAKEEAKGDTKEAKTWRANVILRVLKKFGIADTA